MKNAVIFHGILKLQEFPPHFKICLNRIPRPNRPSGDKIFRKITPSESEANIRLIFRKENFIGMRKKRFDRGSLFFASFLLGKQKKGSRQRRNPLSISKKNNLTQKKKISLKYDYFNISL
ncbi:hypothetical protein ACLSZY_10650 [Avibacterium volantium]|uniref:hypothetical protein n=1 Tax=Avibacterium TaxID=292486 RepID=UPI0039F0C58D